MKKSISRAVCLIFLFALTLPLLPLAQAHSVDGLGLEAYMQNGSRRRYVQAMLGYHLQYNPAVVETLEAGYSAIFFFEGCSDNMDDRALSYIPFYRVSAVCLALRLDGEGKPYIAYFNGQCSTIPDRPLDYAMRKPELGRKSGPATILDGTYEVYSVRHGGAYEALHLRTSEQNATIPAVYMTEGGYAVTQAEMINIHTRNINHILLDKSMWSAGCLLVGDGVFEEFSDLVVQTYYSIYEDFTVGARVGTVTMDRQYLKNELYGLYENQEAVDFLLENSQAIRPEAYLQDCGELQAAPQVLWAREGGSLMTLPCGSETDPRSVLMEHPQKGAELTILGTMENSQGETWYQVDWNGEMGYLRPGEALEPGWLAQRIRDALKQKRG